MKKTYTEKTLEDVLKKAASEKGVTQEQLTYEIIEEKAGFLGIGKEISATVYCDEDIKEFMIEYLQTYFNGIALEANVNVVEEKGFFHVNLDSENNAILIGRNGQTLQSINMVLKSAVSSEFKKRVGVLVDINGYKEEKYKKVCSVALRVAKTVQKTKMDAVLDPMPADERKAIHNFLTTMQNVATVSEGEGTQRRLKIVYSPNSEK